MGYTSKTSGKIILMVVPMHVCSCPLMNECTMTMSHKMFSGLCLHYL